MKYVGKIDDIIFNGKFIIRTTFKPKFGGTVVNKHKQTIGKIHQIIGPVNKPYIIITPNKDLKASFEIIGTDVYIL